MHTPLSIVALFACAGAVSTPALGDFTYALDDGTGSVNIGPPSSFDAFDNTDMIWGNMFEVAGGQDTIVSISVNFGSLSVEPRDVTLIVWDDANNDGDPTDITGPPVSSFTVSATGTPIGSFATYELPSAAVVDGKFFVAAAIRGAVPGGEAAANMDTDSAGDNSWLIYSPDLNEDNLAASIGFASPTSNEAFFVFEGAWTLRANAVPAPGAAFALGFGALFASRRRR